MWLSDAIIVFVNRHFPLTTAKAKMYSDNTILLLIITHIKHKRDLNIEFALPLIII